MVKQYLEHSKEILSSDISEFKDSKRVERELPFEQLSQYSGCEIPQ